MMEVIENLDAVFVTRSFFLLGALAALISNHVPFLKAKYVDYGARSSRTAARSKDPNTGKPMTSTKLNLFDKIVTYPVPHSYFYHYYALSLACSLFWAIQILTRGHLLRLLSDSSSRHGEASMHIDSVMFVWAVMVVQGLRRFYETVEYTKTSSATMPLSIYLVGLAFYFMVNIAVWIEGSQAILTRKSIIDSVSLVKVPNLKTLVFFPVFMCASGIQNDCHRYLASLPKYTLPMHPIFQRLVCPHYSMECIIYLSMAVMAAPEGHWINWTMLSVSVWVLVNLGLVADSTKRWSMNEFGSQNVAGRWRMIPWIW